MNTVLGFLDGSLGLGEMVVIGIIAVLLFGKRLPEVGRSLGRALVEFKKGLGEIRDEIDWSSQPSETDRVSGETDYEEPTAPRFELPGDRPPDEAAEPEITQADGGRAGSSA